MHTDVSMQNGPTAMTTMPWPAGCGGEAAFLGRTRMETHPEFGALRYLEYEAYEPMVLNMLRALAQDAGRLFEVQAVRMVHAVGRVDPGEASVVIQVATPHRGQAFDACRYLIDRLKAELPIWKREHWEQGQTFVQGSVVSVE